MRSASVSPAAARSPIAAIQALLHVDRDDVFDVVRQQFRAARRDILAAIASSLRCLAQIRQVDANLKRDRRRRHGYRRPGVGRMIKKKQFVPMNVLTQVCERKNGRTESSVTRLHSAGVVWACTYDAPTM